MPMVRFFGTLLLSLATTLQCSDIIWNMKWFPVKSNPFGAKIVASAEDGKENFAEVYVAIGTNATVLEGTRIQLSCRAVGKPKPWIMWASSIGSPSDWSGIAAIGDGQTLVIESASSLMSGTYRCIASNVFGSDSKFSVLNVVKPSNIRSSSGGVSISPPGASVHRVVIGEHVHARQGVTLHIHCPASGIPPPSIEWCKDGVVLISAKRHTLRLPDVTAADSGSYMCTASNQMGVASATSTVDVGTEPSILHGQPNEGFVIQPGETVPIGMAEAFVHEGSKVIMRCNARGSPTPTIKWYRDDTQLEHVHEATILYSIGAPMSLEISSMTEREVAIFSCKATNVFGSASASTHLKVLIPPTVATRNESRTILSAEGSLIKTSIGSHLVLLKGASVSISCTVTGVPRPRVKWAHQDKRILAEARIHIAGDNSLRLDDLQVEDSGVYTCMASNEAGTANGSSTLLVAELPRTTLISKFHSSHNQHSRDLRKSQSDLVFPIGRLLHLQCRVTGSPPPKITWLRDHDLIRRVSDSRIRIAGDELQIRNLTLKDSGVYFCVADNKFGSSTAMADIIVGVTPRIHRNVKDEVLSQRSVLHFNVGARLDVRAGSSLHLRCRATGHPKPEIIWKKNGNAMELKTSSNEVLLLDKVTLSASGNYTCLASNAVGDDEASTVVSVFDLPNIIAGTFGSCLKLNISESTILLEKGFQEGHIIEGESVCLICLATGYPLPVMTWKRDHEPIPTSDIENILRTHLLHINQAPVRTLSRRDAVSSRNLRRGSVAAFGTYSRELVNLRDSMIQDEAVLPMHPFNPFSWQTETRIAKFMGEDATVSEGVAVLTGAAIEIGGTYSCQATNRFGHARAEINLTVHPRPRSPYRGYWATTRFGECQPECVRASFGVQDRNVTCRSYHGRQVSDDNCDASVKPDVRKECYTTNCTAVWKKTSWSECSTSCGEDGIQSRDIYCIFAQSKKKIDASECPKAREMVPKRTRECNRLPCQQGECVDSYRYCKLILEFGYCPIDNYKKICCKSCNTEEEFSETNI